MNSSVAESKPYSESVLADAVIVLIGDVDGLVVFHGEKSTAEGEQWIPPIRVTQP